MAEGITLRRLLPTAPGHPRLSMTRDACIAALLRREAHFFIAGLGAGAKTATGRQGFTAADLLAMAEVLGAGTLLIS